MRVNRESEVEIWDSKRVTSALPEYHMTLLGT
jgi:hypothetical protein